MTTKVNKQLATKQDLAIGEGQVTQKRNGKEYILDKIDFLNEAGTASKFVRKFTDLANAVASAKAQEGDVAELKERVIGKGGEATFDYVLASGVTPNTYNIVQCTGNPLLALVLRENSVAFIDKYGAAPSNTVAQNNVIIQACIDLNKGKTIVIPNNGEYLHYGILLDGSSYNNTKIVCNGTLKLAPDPLGTYSNFGGAWVGLIIKDCNDVEVWYRGNGNKSEMIAKQQIHLVGLAGAIRPKFHTFMVNEIRGDGMYVSQSDWLADTANTQDLYIGQMYGRNTDNDGRNLLSIISCSGFEIDFFSSINIGGVIGGVRMPGGLDIEPNNFYQKVTDGIIGTYQSNSDANFGLSILGRESGGDYNVKNITIGTVSIKNTYSGSFGILLEKCERVVISGGRAEYIEAVGGVGGVGIGGSFHRDCNVKMGLYGHRSGTKLGISGEVSDSEYDLEVRNWRDEGFQLCWLTRCNIKGSVYASSVASSNFGVHVRDSNALGGVVMSNTKLSVNVINDGQTARGYRHNPAEEVTFLNCEIVDCNVSGYSTFASAIDNFGQNVRRRNVMGVTEAVAQPQNGTWSVGDFVANVGTIYYPGVNTIITGWIRVTDGSSNIAGTDWAQVSPKDN